MESLFKSMISDRHKSMLAVMENHIASGKSFMLNTGGQVIYHETNKGKYEPEKSNDQLRRINGTTGPLEFMICGKYPFQNCMIVFDEEGLLKELPVNELATTFFAHQFYGDKPVVGNVVVSPGEEVGEM